MATYGSTGIDLYGFDTATNTAISGRIAQVALPAGGSGGDMVFDSTGHLYLVSGGSVNGLLRVNQPIPTTGTNAQLTAPSSAAVTVASPNGVTFDGDGYLYVSSSSQLSKVNPNTGVQVSVVAIGSVSPTTARSTWPIASTTASSRCRPMSRAGTGPAISSGCRSRAGE